MKESRVRISLTMTLLTTLSAPVSAQDFNASERVFVQPTRARDGLSDLATIASQKLPAAVRQSVDLRVMGAADLEALVALEKSKDLLGCDDVSCYAEIAGALGARWLVRSELGLSGDQVAIECTLIDAADFSTVRTVSRRVLRDGVVIEHAAIEIARALFQRETAEPTLELRSQLELDAANRERLPADVRADLERRNQDERVAQQMSGLPLNLWVSENWTAYQWQKFQASGLSRRDYVEHANREETLPFVLELVFGGMAAVGLPLSGAVVGGALDDKYMPLTVSIGMVGLAGFLTTALFDALANPSLRYAGDER